MAGTLLDLRRALGQDTGDFGLFGAGPDFTTDGAQESGSANRFINAAIRRVTDYVPESLTHGVAHFSCFAGQTSVPVANLKVAKRLVFVSEEGEISEPDQVSPEDIQRSCPGATGAASIWAQGVARPIPESNVLSTAAQSGLTGPGWQVSSPWTRSLLSLTVNGTTTGATGSAIYWFDGAVLATPQSIASKWGELELNFYLTYRANDPDTTANKLIVEYYDFDEVDWVELDVLNASGQYTLTLPSTATAFRFRVAAAYAEIILSEVRAYQAGTYTGVPSNAGTNTIIQWAPELDEASMVQVHGIFYPTELSLTTDYNSLTLQHEGLVNAFARAEWAFHRGYFDQARQHEAYAVDLLLRGLGRDRAEVRMGEVRGFDGHLYFED